MVPPPPRFETTVDIAVDVEPTDPAFICLCTGVCLQSCVNGVCSTLIDKEEQLNELDRGSGDGDCGTTLTAGLTGKEGQNINSNTTDLSRVCVCVFSSYSRERLLYSVGQPTAGIALPRLHRREQHGRYFRSGKLTTRLATEGLDSQSAVSKRK